MAAKKKKPPGNPELAALWEKPRRRPARVADAIKNEIALLLIRKIKDPRLSQLAITQVKVTDDLRTAWIYFSVFDENLAEDAIAGFDKATGFIRSQIAKVLPLRSVPRLIFKQDRAVIYQAKMDRLLNEIEVEDEPID